MVWPQYQSAVLHQRTSRVVRAKHASCAGPESRNREQVAPGLSACLAAITRPPEITQTPSATYVDGVREPRRAQVSRAANLMRCFRDP